jgi:hypothetical protein
MDKKKYHFFSKKVIFSENGWKFIEVIIKQHPINL